jgi:hypothetical protein
VPEFPPLLMPLEPLVLPPLVCAQAPPPMSSAIAAVARNRTMSLFLSI